MNHKVDLCIMGVLTMALLGMSAVVSGRDYKIDTLETNISGQSKLIGEMTSDITDYYELKIEYELYKEESKLRLALDPLKDLLSEDEIIELLKEIPHGSPFRIGFSVTAPFGESIGYHGFLRSEHEGIDLVVNDLDWTITPIAPGTVERIGHDRIYGKFLYIRHSERVRSFYAHGAKIYYSAAVGAAVDSDSKIMLMGDTGQADGNHLHFEIQVFTGERWVSIDPYPFIRS